MITTVKNSLKKLDYYFFNKLLYKKYCKFFTDNHRIIHEFYKKIAFIRAKKLTSNKIDIFYSRNNNKQKNLLGKLFDKYGSTKSVHHYYEDIYDLIFSINRDKINLILECGIGHEYLLNHLDKTTQVIAGAGLRAYRDYFYNASIIGIDINSNVIFTEDRINTYICDQTSKQSINNFILQTNLQPNTVDVIIDDGLHEFNANITLFENTRHLLTDNGIYIIEDIASNKLYKYISYFKNLINKYNIKYISVNRQEYPVFLILITKKF